jgi:alkylation response protein AidB-like acyl-CoA dehydrogenase
MSASKPYRFDPYLEALPTDWYADDPDLDRLLGAFAPDSDRAALTRWGVAVAGPLRRLAEDSARPENAPRLRAHDAFDRRVDDIVLPAATLEALALVAGEAVLGDVRGDPFVHYAMVYLLAQNGEAGVACSVACTDGLVRALEALGDLDVHREALRQVRESSPQAFAHAAQFVTEIQGGSDVPANRLRAVADGDSFRLHGQKWFCSNINADWFLMTARPETATGPGPDVGLFLVPAHAESGRRNGYTVDRLKDKLGTRELATAEVTFHGARAWPVGPLDRGIPNLLRYVLTPSRFACVIFAAGALRQAERIAAAYGGFRRAFGHCIADYPLVARTLDQIASARAGALTCVFELLRLWHAAEAGGYRNDDAIHFRILLSLAKPVWTRRATDLLHDAMLVLGGNGIEERFSPLPRLYRDNVIMETWEGPHSLLYTQALNDLVRFDVDPAGFVERARGRGRDQTDGRLADALAEAMAATRNGQDGTVLLAEIAPRLLV